jgi:HAD superfamily hydrolase (TIGR01509 family)
VSDIRYIFLDNGGVITDNSRRSALYPGLVAEYFVPRLGGEPDAWARANREVFPQVWQRHVPRMETWDPSRPIHESLPLYQLDWLRTMCAMVGAEGPADDAECATLAIEADRWISSRLRTPYPGAEETIESLAREYVLCTASEGLSDQIAIVLGAAGIRDCFLTLYGPDLIQTPKQSPLYHQRIFDHAGIDPATAVVLDDGPLFVERARAAGAHALLVSSEAAARNEPGAIGLLAELPAWLAGRRLVRI